MTLGGCIREYRHIHGISQRQFAEMCDLSNAYISILEKNINPKTGYAPVPTFGVYKKVADAMGITVDDLFKKADDSYVSVGSKMTLEMPAVPFSGETQKMIDHRIEEADTAKKELVELFRTLTDRDKDKLLDFARFLADSYKRPDKRRK